MQNPAVASTYLTVSFKDKDAAKALGARWDSVQRQWYVPEGRELTPFVQWLPAGKGSAFLHARTEQHSMLDATVISWGYAQGIGGHSGFDAYLGTSLPVTDSSNGTW